MTTLVLPHERQLRRVSPASDTLMVDPLAGRIAVPKALTRALSTPQGGRVWRQWESGEIGIFTTLHKRPVYNCELGNQLPLQHPDVVRKRLSREHGAWCIERYELVMVDITHNERVDAGAAEQDDLLFGAGGTVFTAVAVASAALTKTKTDQSLGSASSGVTTNEFTTIGLSRAAGSLGSYTAPSSLGAQFTRRVTKAFSVTGTGTAKGAGIFNSTTVASSILYVEDNFTDANVVNGDTLTVNADISN